MVTERPPQQRLNNLLNETLWHGLVLNCYKPYQDKYELLPVYDSANDAIPHAVDGA
jgi:hypothetical protein